MHAPGKTFYCSLLTMLMLALWRAPAQAGEELVLVVNTANPVSSISRQEAKNIFLGKKKTWADDEPIILIVQEGTPIHELFTTTITRKSPLQYATYWKKMLFTGQGIYPLKAANDRAVIDFVAAQPDSIGYISKSSLTTSVKKLALIEH